MVSELSALVPGLIPQMSLSKTQVEHDYDEVHGSALARFEADGFVVIRRALSPALLGRLVEAHSRVLAEERELGRLGNRDAMHSFAFVDRDPAFAELLDLETTFPLVVDVLGWNIHVYHSHIDAHPPLDGPRPQQWGWHQDGTRQNVDLETDPRPRLSVKVAYFLSDVSQPGRGNMLVLPGSHLRNSIPRPHADCDVFEQPSGAQPILAHAGDAVIFDRRLWHSRSDNLSVITRRALFLAYTYRWIVARDDKTYDPEWIATLSPVKRQLLGAGTGNFGRWLPELQDVPLRRISAGAAIGRSPVSSDRSTPTEAPE
jgi:ectoine hydroxylase